MVLKYTHTIRLKGLKNSQNISVGAHIPRLATETTASISSLDENSFSKHMLEQSIKNNVDSQGAIRI